MENKAVCRKVSSMLSLYIDNRVTYPQRAFIEDHIANCKECYTKYLYLKSLIKDLKDSYKQVLELSVKKQKQKTFNIREHEKFLENLSPYVDNELEAKECFEFRKYLMKSKNAQRELKNVYILQKELRLSFDKTKKNITTDLSRRVMDTIKEKNELRYKEKIREIFLSQKTLKIAILSGLILLGGYEFDQLYKQSKTPAKQEQTMTQEEKAEHLKKAQSLIDNFQIKHVINP